MKFAKTYLQTMTDPSFPKEWREKGLEYKELKKLINGVVAELESLGLSADVLRDLLEPPRPDQSEHEPSSAAAAAAAAAKAAKASANGTQSQFQQSSHGADPESDTDELSTSLVAGLAKLSTGRPAPSAFIDPLSPLMEEEEARRRSVEQAMNVPPFAPDVMPAPLLDADSPMASGTGSEAGSSPAREWIASINHSRPSSSRAASGKRRSRKASSSGRSASGSSNPSSREPSAQPEPASSSALLDASDDSADFVRASPMSMLGIRKRRDESAERGSSAEAESRGPHDRALSPTSSWRMGKKDLEELRRNSHSGNGTRPAVPGAKGKRRASQGVETSQSDADDNERHDWGGHAWRERQDLGWDPPRPCSALPRQHMNGNGAARQSSQPAGATSPGSKPRWVQGKDGRRARAEYELAGTPEHPIPRIKLIIESPVHSDEEESGSESGGDDDDGKITELPPSAPGSRRPSQSEEGSAPTSSDAPMSATADAASASAPQRMHTREIIIPLTADTEFLDTLTASLTKLSELQKTQKDTFVTSTENLCASVARAASPYATKNDLYVWREIFALWVDMQIFESQREKDRGELSVDESEARLKRFAQELAKRGWLAESAVPRESPAAGGAKLSRKKTAMESALTLPMKDSRSVSTVEDFLRLNLALLDLKKFQRVNVEAARKILKKHDKRTALTASTGLRAFMTQQEAGRAMAAAMGGGGGGPHGLMMPAESTGTLVAPAYGTHPSLAALLPSSTTGLLSESLPHILLSLLTTTLLPILPSVDDYSCAICTGLAWRPIRLDCTHLFCIRCLVKLQKQGKADCPLCRAPNVVSSADGRNMDEATVNMLRLWFPQEVSEKDQENERDRKKEELAEMGFEHHKCTVM